jgi:predicted porin
MNIEHLKTDTFFLNVIFFGPFTMKKSLLAFALMGAFSSAALAQSSVTVYGILDAGIAYKKAGAGTVTSLDSGLNSTSRLGFKGTEDLGNGLKANFVLEMGLKADTGANDTALFARGAYVGLTEKELGTVNLGRHKSLTYVYGAAIDPFADGLLGKTDLMFKINSVRDNSVTYFSNNFSGLTVAAQYGFGEKAGNATAGSVNSVAASYTSGPLLASVVWDSVKDTNGNLSTSSAGGEKILAGAVYDFGSFKLHGAWEQIQGSVSLTNLNKTKEQLWLLGASVKFDANTVMVSYTDSQNKTTARSNSNRIALGYTYDLSKRTNLYSSVALVKNDPLVKTLADANGAKAGLFNVGVRHRF